MGYDRIHDTIQLICIDISHTYYVNSESAVFVVGGSTVAYKKRRAQLDYGYFSVNISYLNQYIFVKVNKFQ